MNFGHFYAESACQIYNSPKTQLSSQLPSRHTDTSTVERRYHGCKSGTSTRLYHGKMGCLIYAGIY